MFLVLGCQPAPLRRTETHGPGVKVAGRRVGREACVVGSREPPLGDHCWAETLTLVASGTYT